MAIKLRKFLSFIYLLVALTLHKHGVLYFYISIITYKTK